MFDWTPQEFIRRMLRGVLSGVVAYLLAYYLPLVLLPSSFIPTEYTTTYNYFVVVAVLFSALMEFFSDTVVAYALGIGRVFLITLLLIHSTDGGTLTANFTEDDSDIELIVNVSTFLTILACMCILDIAKYALQAINHVIEGEVGEKALEQGER